jgi:hypothetical protein
LQGIWICFWLFLWYLFKLLINFNQFLLILIFPLHKFILKLLNFFMFHLILHFTFTYLLIQLSTLFIPMAKYFIILFQLNFKEVSLMLQPHLLLLHKVITILSIHHLFLCLHELLLENCAHALEFITLIKWSRGLL